MGILARHHTLVLKTDSWSRPTVPLTRFATNRSAAENRPCIELLDEAVVQVLRGKTSAQRVAMIFAANRTMRLRLEGHLRTRHPDWDDLTLAREIARRMLYRQGLH
jgi:hypothetical protein